MTDITPSSRNQPKKPIPSSGSPLRSSLSNRQIDQPDWSSLPPEIKAKIGRSLSDEDKLAYARTDIDTYNTIMSDQTHELGKDAFHGRNYDSMKTYCEHLSKYPRLKSLSLRSVTINGEQINDAQLKEIINFLKNNNIEIQELDLSFQNNLSLKDLPTIPSLRKLNLEESKNITDENFNAFIKQNNQLEALDIGSTKISLQDIPPLPSLKELHCSGNGYITDENFNAFIKQSNQLEALSIGSTAISLQDIPPLPNLKALHCLGNNCITDENLNAFTKQNNQLEALDISHTKLSLKNAPPLAHLRELRLKHNNWVTSESFNQSINNSPNLEILDLEKTNLSLENAPPLKRLRNLNLRENATITNDNLNKLLRHSPNLEILNLRCDSNKYPSPSSFSKDHPSLKNAPAMPKLKDLDCRFNKAVKDEYLDTFLKKSPTIEILRLEGADISLTNTPCPPRLKELDLGPNKDVLSLNNNFTIENLERFLEGHPSLKASDYNWWGL